ncbi:A-agglutinin anchorage subunit-like isoform X3 [Protopterus annectens]|uniref:A-agglutinin anchorage subunit-like isoform X3 n=1 Tax=Protopterus annectens TaxID=7888 RepID=UPI001CFA4887|nr:A-agglutinin anchorage subunit-like isoform X3 [Protopterus annectens]
MHLQCWWLDLLFLQLLIWPTRSQNSGDVVYGCSSTNPPLCCTGLHIICNPKGSLCSCHSSCTFFKTCCHDYIDTCQNGNNTTTTDVAVVNRGCSSMNPPLCCSGLNIICNPSGSFCSCHSSCSLLNICCDDYKATCQNSNSSSTTDLAVVSRGCSSSNPPLCCTGMNIFCSPTGTFCSCHESCKFLGTCCNDYVDTCQKTEVTTTVLPHTNATNTGYNFTLFSTAYRPAEVTTTVLPHTNATNTGYNFTLVSTAYRPGTDFKSPSPGVSKLYSTISAVTVSNEGGMASKWTNVPQSNVTSVSAVTNTGQQTEVSKTTRNMSTEAMKGTTLRNNATLSTAISGELPNSMSTQSSNPNPFFTTTTVPTNKTSPLLTTLSTTTRSNITTTFITKKSTSTGTSVVTSFSTKQNSSPQTTGIWLTFTVLMLVLSYLPHCVLF